MPTLRFKGSYGSSVTLVNPRTADLTAEDTVPSSPIVVLSAYARIYVSTTNRSRRYTYTATINGGYSGTLEYSFAHTDEPVYVDVPLTVTQEDPAFPVKNVTSVTVVESGGYGDSTRIRGTVRVIVEYAHVGYPTAPSNIRLNGQTAINLQADYPAELTWSAGAVGNYDVFSYYQIIRKDPLDNTETVLGTTTSTQYMITAPYEDSRSYYFYVKMYTRYMTALSSTYASIYTFIPLTAPSFLGNNPFNPRPMVLTTLGQGPRSDLLVLVADGWTPSRKAVPESKVYLRRNTAYTGAVFESVNVTETDELVRTVTGTLEISYTPPAYTQPTIVSGGTIVKAADISELQQNLNTIREAYGMTASVFTPCEAGVTSLGLWQTHIAELHQSIKEIQTFVNSWDTQSSSYAIILPNLITSYGPRAAVINQIRQIITML